MNWWYRWVRAWIYGKNINNIEFDSPEYWNKTVWDDFFCKK